MKISIKKILVFILSVVIIIISVISCGGPYYFRSDYKDANAFLHKSETLNQKPFLKAHFKNGNVIILKDSWTVDTVKNQVEGIGVLYDFNRNKIIDGNLFFPIDSVALFECNERLVGTENARILTLSILTGLDVALGMFCLSNPKACFGSCPTFYLDPDKDFHYSDAEGFSSSILPSMEKGDIDDLDFIVEKKDDFSIFMKNEAFETHCVNQVQLAVFPVKNGENVYSSNEEKFYLCQNTYKLKDAVDMEGKTISLLSEADKNERFSPADENDMVTKEELYLEFSNVENQKDLGLILHFRQTMMTTYLFYSIMGYMGDQVTEFFTKLELEDDKKQRFNNLIEILGGIEVYVWNNDKWQYQGQFNESGPIAINKQIIRLQNINSQSDVKIKLKLNKGFWRIDYAALTGIEKEVYPVMLDPVAVSKDSVQDTNALGSVLNEKRYLISMPGDIFRFDFAIPDNSKNYKAFLYSRGYYLEWMREYWLKDKDILKLSTMMKYPRLFLKMETQEYKIYEEEIEQSFWDSRLDVKNFSYYDK